MNISSSVLTPPVSGQASHTPSLRPRRAVADAVVAVAQWAAVCVLAVGAVDRLRRPRRRGRRGTCRRGATDGRRRVALHRGRIGVAVVVDRAELEAARRRVVAVERQRRLEDQLRRIVVLGRDHDRRRRLGQAGARVRRRAVAGLGDARPPDAEEPPALVGVRAQVGDARALAEQHRAAVLDLLERLHVLDEDVVGVEDAAGRGTAGRP